MWKVLTLLTAGLACVQAAAQLPFNTFTPSSQIKSTNLTDLVQWDGYSLFVKGERIFLYSGEVHPFRLIVPDLWLDVMQRIKALGFNAISMYTYWGIYNPAPGVMDIDGWKDFEPFIEAANEAGLWVVARPGPYINAEVSGGGIPGWVTTLNTTLRTHDPVWTAAYEPYWKAMGDIFARQQITQGGPIIGVQIENEYFLNSQGDLDLDYIAHLESLMRSYGIVVPFTFNDVSQDYRLYEGKGAVDIYGADSYPQNTDCLDPFMWRPVVTTYRSYFQNTSGVVGTPFYIPEFQAGWIPGITTLGYSQCESLFGSAFERVFYLNNIAQAIKMQSIYMVYGGTNYGHTAFPRGLTSYDYWAAINEDRSLKDKYYELKLISHFVRSARSLPKTWLAGSSNSSYTSLAGTILVDELRNPDDNAGFYVVRHQNSSSLAVDTFSMYIQDWQGNATVPMQLDGRDSRIVVANYCFGQSCISHSSAAVFTSTSIGHVDVLVLYGNSSQQFQLAFPDPNCHISQISGSSSFDISSDGARTVVKYTIASGDHSILKVLGGTREVNVHVLDTSVANFAWEVVVPSSQQFGNHYSIGSNETVLVLGPYLARNATGSSGTLNINADINGTQSVTVVAPPQYTALSWNGAAVQASSTNGTWTITAPGPQSTPSTPVITGWKRKDSLPEIAYGYDDSSWVVCNNETTYNPLKPYANYTGKYVLYGRDYGYVVGDLIFRGHFKGTGNETGLAINMSPGTDGTGAIWINGQYAGSAVVANVDGVEDVNTTVTFPPGSVKNGSDNVIQIVLNNVGLEENAQFTSTNVDIKSPRGIRGYTLIGGNGSGYEITWKIQGNEGGNTAYPDRVRGIFNLGGLYGERMGWYLPGYDDSAWEQASPSQSVGAPGVWFYRAQVDIDYPSGTDVHYSFVFPDVTGGFRAQLFVNGWQFGMRYGDLGPQLLFPVPPGILKQGTNSIALSLFAVNETESSYSLGGDLKLQVDPSVTTTTLSLKDIAPNSPTYQDIFGH